MYRENVINVFDLSDSGMYLLLYTGSVRNTKHLKLLDLEMMEMTVSIDLPDEPVDCRMNRAMTLVYVLTKDHLLVFDLTDGQKWCEYSTLINDKFRLNSCFDFTEDGEDVAFGGEDRVAILFNKGRKQGEMTEHSCSFLFPNPRLSANLSVVFSCQVWRSSPMNGTAPSLSATPPKRPPFASSTTRSSPSLYPCTCLATTTSSCFACSTTSPRKS